MVWSGASCVRHWAEGALLYLFSIAHLGENNKLGDEGVDIKRSEADEI